MVTSLGVYIYIYKFNVVKDNLGLGPSNQMCLWCRVAREGGKSGGN